MGNKCLDHVIQSPKNDFFKFVLTKFGKVYVVPNQGLKYIVENAPYLAKELDCTTASVFSFAYTMYMPLADRY